MSSFCKGQFRSKIHKPIKQHCSEFCTQSSIHGISHIAHGSGWDRLFWLAMLLVSLASCGLLISSVYSKWTQKPVIVSYDDAPTSVLQIPFPAMTICPEMKFDPEALNYSGVFGTDAYVGDLLDDETTEIFRSVAQVCDNAVPSGLPVPSDVIGTLKRISLIRKIMVLRCTLGPYLCGSSTFRETITDQGICLTFNLLPERDLLHEGNVLHDYDDYESSSSSRSDWSVDDGFRPFAGLHTYPNRSLGAGVDAGLRLWLMLPEDPERDESYRCRRWHGYKVALHSPDEYPSRLRNAIHLGSDQLMKIVIGPAVITTSSEVRKYPPSKRRCLFSHEQGLRFFKIYSRENCDLECLAEFTLKLCGCVRFWMPRDNRTEVCPVDRQVCCKSAEQAFVVARARIEIGEGERALSCECLPSCNSIQFNAESMEVISGKQKLSGFNEAIMNVYFKLNQYMVLRRSELFGWTDFLANCGGVLGLCMGVSLLSLVELVFYCVVRPVVGLIEGRLQRKGGIAKQANHLYRDGLRLEGVSVEQGVDENYYLKLGNRNFYSVGHY